MQPDPLDFNEVQSQIQRLYQKQAYLEALELAELAYSAFPDQKAIFYYWRICMNARIGCRERALELLQEVLEQEFWYSEILLRKSPSLLTLQGEKAFEQLVKKNAQLQQEDQEHLFPILALHARDACLPGTPACPALIGLHSNTSTAQLSLPFWQPAAAAGWLVAVPQSSQAMWKDAYMWDDKEIAVREIRRHYHAILEKYPIDPRRVVIAGHSMGGEIAGWIALTGVIPVKGFIAFGPGGPMMDEPERWQETIDACQLRLERQGGAMRAYLVVGEDDIQISHTGVKQFGELLNRAGILCEVETVPQAGHDYQPEYEIALLRGLDFIEAA